MKNLGKKPLYNMEKKGVSAIVATVLLLLLTVAAVTALSQFIVPWVKNTLYGSTECLSYKDYFKFEEKVDGNNLNCYKIYGSDVYQAASIKVKPGVNESDENVRGFQISFQTESESKIFEINKTSGTDGNSAWVLGDKNSLPYKHYYPSPGEIISYAFNAGKIYDRAEIRAVLKNGKVCESSDSINIIKCEIEINT
jgi:flagellin-like protein